MNLAITANAQKHGECLSIILVTLRFRDFAVNMVRQPLASGRAGPISSQTGESEENPLQNVHKKFKQKWVRKGRV